MPLNMPVQCAVDRSAILEVFLVEIARAEGKEGVVVFFDGVGGLYGAPPGEPSAVSRRPSTRQHPGPARRR